MIEWHCGFRRFGKFGGTWSDQSREKTTARRGLRYTSDNSVIVPLVLQRQEMVKSNE